jgi:hypothetical protein
MRTVCLTTFFLAAASVAFGQLDSDTITIQASRSTNFTPDQIAFNVAVAADPATSLDQVVAALASSGVTAANLSGLSGAQDVHSPLQWTFSLAVPFAKMKATIAALTALQQSFAQNPGSMTLAFAVQGLQYSMQLIQTQTCAAKDLFADALAQAQPLATLAGLAIGPVVALSDGSVAVGQFAFGQLNAVGYAIPNSLIRAWYNPGSPPGCYLAVTFQLLRYQ